MQILLEGAVIDHTCPSLPAQDAGSYHTDGLVCVLSIFFLTLIVQVREHCRLCHLYVPDLQPFGFRIPTICKEKNEMNRKKNLGVSSEIQNTPP